MSLKHAILAALSSKPQTGYELSRDIDGSIGYFWHSTHQQIYKELQNLHNAGWLIAKEIAQSEKPNKKIYRVSSTGLKELKKWISEEAELPQAKDALLIKLFAAHWVEPSVFLGVFKKHYQKRMARLKKYLEIEEKYFKQKKLSTKMRYQYLTVRRGIIFEKAWLAWADEVMALQ